MLKCRLPLILFLLLPACAPGPNAQPQPSVSPSANASANASVTPPVQAIILAQSVDVSTLAGQGSYGYEDGLKPFFYHPSSLVVNPAGEALVLDRQNHRIRKVLPNGLTSTFWGDGERGNRDGVSGTGRFNQPVSLMLAGADDELLIADAQNHTLRRLKNGELTTFAGTGDTGFKDGMGTQAAFNWPSDLVRDTDGTLYVSDRFNHAIRKITPDGQVTTLAGNGVPGYDDSQGSAARFNEPMALIMGPDRYLYVSDAKNHIIRKVSLSGDVITFAGSGQPGSRDDNRLRAEFREPAGLLFAKDGSLYVTDRFNHRIRVISPAGQVTSLAGNGVAANKDGPGADASFSYPFDIAFDAQGNILVADHGTHAIRKITFKK